MEKIFAIVGICLLTIALISGCTEMGEVLNENSCNLFGGTWMEKYGQCCPKGCPLEEPIDLEEKEAAEERCGICWLP